MTDGNLVWDEEALKKLDQVPAFVRGMAKGKIEKAAKAKGVTRITVELLDEIKKEVMG